MAPLTWREVSAPSFAGVSEAQARAAALMSNGFDSAINALGRMKESQNQAATSGFAQRILGYGGDTAALNRDLQNGTIMSGLNGNVDPDMLKWAGTRETTALSNQGLALANAGTAESNRHNAWDNRRVEGYEAARPAANDVVAQINYLAGLGTEEAYRQAQTIARDNNAALSAAGMTADGIENLFSNNRTNSQHGAQTVDALVQAGLGREDLARTQQADELYRGFVTSQLDSADAIKALDAQVAAGTVDPKVANLVRAQLSSPDGQANFGQQVSPVDFILDQSLQERQSGYQGRSLAGFADATEGAGNYSTLFGHAQRDGGPFAGVDVSQMTIGQLDQFAGNYGRWVAGKNNGTVATPMGRYQIVNSTLQGAARELGLSSDTVFDQATQDRVFQHLVDRRISGPKSMAGKMASLRQEWVGFKSIPDGELAAAITAYENGDRNALLGSGGAGPTRQNAVAAQTAPLQSNQTPAQTALEQALASRGSLTAGQNQALVDRGLQQGSRVQSILNTMTADNMFNDMGSVLADLQDPEVQNLSSAEAAAQLKEKLGEDYNLGAPDLADKLNQLKDTYGLAPGLAASMIENATSENWPLFRFITGRADVNDRAVKDLVDQLYNADGKTTAEQLQPATALFQATQARRAQAEQLQQAQARVAEAELAYFTAAERAKSNPSLAGRAEQRLERYKAMQAELDRILGLADQNPMVTAFTNGKR